MQHLSLIRVLLTAAALFVFTASAHVALLEPCARGQFRGGCSTLAGNKPDYDIRAPIGTEHAITAPMCKNTFKTQPYKTYKAGSSVHTKYDIGAAHGGGTCQYALSYDDGKTFVVIHTIVDTCLKNPAEEYDVPIPITAPTSDDVVFAWAWTNNEGVREYYMNCANVAIAGTGTGTGPLVGPALATPNYGPTSPKIPERFVSGYLERTRQVLAARPQIAVRAGAITTLPPSPWSTKTVLTPLLNEAANEPVQQPTHSDTPSSPTVRCSQTSADSFEQLTGQVWVPRPAPPGTRCTSLSDGSIAFSSL